MIGNIALDMRNADSPDSPWPGPLRGWTVVVLLALASMVSQFDRTVVNLMVEPIKAEFALDDTQFGMLQGIAFGIFYILACIPIGRLVDRYSRTLILGVTLGMFSLFAMASGLTRNFTQLFLTRVGVGVGEASVTPAALSMLSDLFPPEKLGRPVSGFLMSAPIGQGVAFIGGGSLLQWLTTSSFLSSGLVPGTRSLAGGVHHRRRARVAAGAGVPADARTGSPRPGARRTRCP